MDSHSRDGSVTSFRAETMGVLRAMRGLQGKWDGLVHHWLDNEAVAECIWEAVASEPIWGEAARKIVMSQKS